MKFPINANDYHSGIFSGLNHGLCTQQQIQQVHIWLLQMAGGGSGQAQANLGVMYAKGIGAPESPMEAAKWFQLAAAQANGLGLYNLGIAREDRRVTGLNENSRSLYERSEAAGYQWAGLRLSQTDIDSACKGTMKSAYMAFRALTSQGGLQALEVRRVAMFWRAACQLYGRGVRVNRKAGMANMLQAAMQGDSSALHFLYDYHFRRGPGFPTDMRWGIFSAARLYPQEDDVIDLYVLWQLLPEKHNPREDYLLRNVGHHDRIYAEQKIAVIRKALADAETLVFETRMDDMLWARESGILELHQMNRIT